MSFLPGKISLKELERLKEAYNTTFNQHMHRRINLFFTQQQKIKKPRRVGAEKY